MFKKNSKKVILIFMFAAAAFVFAGCSSGGSGSEGSVQSSAIRSPVSGEEKLVSITIPARVFDKCKKYINSDSFSLGTPEKDGENYVYKISSSGKKSLISEIKKQVLYDLSALATEKNSIESIETDSDFTHITLMCGDGYKSNQELFAAAYNYILTYRAFSEAEGSENFSLGYSAINSHTYEIITEGVYPPESAAADTPTPEPIQQPSSEPQSEASE